MHKNMSRMEKWIKVGDSIVSAIKVYINIHPEYNYSTAIVQCGFIDDLMSFIRQNDGFCYDKISRPPQIIIPRETGMELEAFKDFLFCHKGMFVYSRDKRSEDWVADERNPKECELA